MAVIHAAKKISEAGTKLDKLARQIADQCPESNTKQDLLAYLQRIALYCHQLNITSKVHKIFFYFKGPAPDLKMTTQLKMRMIFHR